MHVDGQDPRLMASESKANHAVSSVVFHYGNALSWESLKLEINWTSVFIHQRKTKKWPKYLEVWNLTRSLRLLIRVTKTGTWYLCPVMNKEWSSQKSHVLSGLCFHSVEVEIILATKSCFSTPISEWVLKKDFFMRAKVTVKWPQRTIQNTLKGTTQSTT